MDEKRKALTSWVQLGLYCALILGQATLPLPMKPFHHADKVVHFLAYGVLGVLVFRALRFLPWGDRLAFRVIMAIVISGLVGLSDEILQVFVPTRTLDKDDLYYDVAGCFTGIMVYILYKINKNRAASDERVPVRRIVTRPDFDGIVCAAFLLDFIPETEKQGIRWLEPGWIQNRQVTIEKGDILANLPYHENCAMWFDHHVTNRIETPFEGAFAIEPSAARVIYDHFREQAMEKHHELVVQADKIDSADLTEAEVLRPEDYPHVLLSMTVSGRREADEPYWNKLVNLLRKKSIEEVMADPDVAERCEKVVEQNRAYRELLLSHTRLCGHVAVTDFRTCNTAPEGNRFLAYSLFPEAVVSVKIRHDQKDRNHVVLSVGHSIFNKNCKVNAGALLSRYHGGGHFGAAACRFPSSFAERYISEIIATLEKNEPLDQGEA